MSDERTMGDHPTPEIPDNLYSIWNTDEARFAADSRGTFTVDRNGDYEVRLPWVMAHVGVSPARLKAAEDRIAVLDAALTSAKDQIAAIRAAAENIDNYCDRYDWVIEGFIRDLMAALTGANS